MIANCGYFLAAVVSGIILFIGSLLLPGYYGAKYEVHANNMILLLIPFVIWLLLSGQIQKFKFGTSGLELAFQRAVSARAAVHVDKIPIQELLLTPKESLAALPRVLQTRPQALSCKKNDNDYYDARVLGRYIAELSKLSEFKYFIFFDINDKLLGAISLSDFLKSVGITNGQQPATRRIGRANRNRPENSPQLSLQALADILNNKQPDEPLRQLPGFISADLALKQEHD